VILTGEQRAVRIAPPRRQAFTAVTRVSAQRAASSCWRPFAKYIHL
jgi:hypothetical protein